MLSNSFKWKHYEGKLSGFVAKLVKTFTIRKNDSLYQEENGT